MFFCEKQSLLKGTGVFYMTLRASTGSRQLVQYGSLHRWLNLIRGKCMHPDRDVCARATIDCVECQQVDARCDRAGVFTAR